MGKLDKIMKWGHDFEETMLSLVKIPLMSRRPSALPRHDEVKGELVIL